MFVIKILIQLISLYRAIAMLFFIMFYTIMPCYVNLILLITAITSDLLDGFLAKKYKLTSIGGQLLDLFSDKYLNCISIIYLIIEGFPMLPLLFILTKEIFVLSFRSVKINGEFIISTNRTIGGFMTGMLWGIVFLHTGNINFIPLTVLINILRTLNLIYLLYKIYSNYNNLKKVFKNWYAYFNTVGKIDEPVVMHTFTIFG